MPAMPIRLLKPLFVLGFVFAATACGSGDSDDSTPSPDTTNTPPPSPTAAISGYAAMGRALPSGSPVRARCAVGNAETTTAADGSYSLPTSALTLPCMLQASFGSGESVQLLHSYAAAASTAHITPLTHASVAQALTGSDPAAVFASPTTIQLQTLAAQLPATQQLLRDLLRTQGLGTPLAAFGGDFITGTLVPATASSTGDIHDQLIDATIAHFGVIDALTHSLVTWTVTSPGLIGRVDWSHCLRNNPTDKSGYDCGTGAVVLMDAPQNYVDPTTGYLEWVFDRSLVDIAYWPGELPTRCAIRLSVSRLQAEDPPLWAITEKYLLNSWQGSLFFANGNAALVGISGDGNLYGNLADRGNIVAGSQDGGNMELVYTTGGNAGIVFINGVIEQIGPCVRPNNYQIPAATP